MLLCPLLDGEDVNDDTLTTYKTEESEEDHELEAVAKHFGKELSEITLEALIKLEQKNPKEEGENENLAEDDVPKRDAPSLASILGRMPSAATLGLNESIGDCISNEKENGECSQMFNFICFICLHQINCLISRKDNPIWNYFQKNLIN